MIIFGLRTRASNEGAQALVCPRCGTSQLHRLVRRKRFFSLFFVPVLPLGSTYTAVCANCGNRQHLSAKLVNPLPVPTMYACPTCRAAVSDTDAFCKRCGAKVGAPPATTTTEADQLESGPTPE